MQSTRIGFNGHWSICSTSVIDKYPIFSKICSGSALPALRFATNCMDWCRHAMMDGIIYAKQHNKLMSTISEHCNHYTIVVNSHSPEWQTNMWEKLVQYLANKKDLGFRVRVPLLPSVSLMVYAVYCSITVDLLYWQWLEDRILLLTKPTLLKYRVTCFLC